MPSTPQSQAISIVNALCGIMQQLKLSFTAAQQLDSDYTQLDVSALLAAFPTCATNPDGSLGDADATPVTDHVIDNRVVSTLDIALSSYDIGIMLNVAQAFVSLLAGETVAQQAYAPSVLAQIIETS